MLHFYDRESDNNLVRGAEAVPRPPAPVPEPGGHLPSSEQALSSLVWRESSLWKTAWVGDRYWQSPPTTWFLRATPSQRPSSSNAQLWPHPPATHTHPGPFLHSPVPLSRIFSQPQPNAATRPAGSPALPVTAALLPQRKGQAGRWQPLPSPPLLEQLPGWGALSVRLTGAPTPGGHLPGQGRRNRFLGVTVNLSLGGRW